MKNIHQLLRKLVFASFLTLTSLAAPPWASAHSVPLTIPHPGPYRDPSMWPRGYYPGDPLPPKTIYLTFDDGPWAFTGQLVDILKEEGVHATFFMNAFDKDHPNYANIHDDYLFHFAKVLKELVADGNVIGDHTYSHRDLATLTPQQIHFQLYWLEHELRKVLGPQMPAIHLFRPPYGSPWLGHWNTNAQKRKVTKALNGQFFVMMWTIGWDSADSIDWAKGEWYEPGPRYHPNTPQYKAKMKRDIDRILNRAHNGASGIILMHDTHPTSRDSLKTLIEILKKRGYRFDTLDNYCRWRWGPHVFDQARPAEAVH
ncbi:MAG: polysaccharide deacetylase family protein [Spirochaetales bacterium]|nr:polysaccharide deacetylase family protein [Spirochaetales bacterium]